MVGLSGRPLEPRLVVQSHISARRQSGRLSSETPVGGFSPRVLIYSATPRGGWLCWPTCPLGKPGDSIALFHENTWAGCSILNTFATSLILIAVAGFGIRIIQQSLAGPLIGSGGFRSIRLQSCLGGAASNPGTTRVRQAVDPGSGSTPSRVGLGALEKPFALVAQDGALELLGVASHLGSSFEAPLRITLLLALCTLPLAALTSLEQSALQGGYIESSQADCRGRLFAQSYCSYSWGWPTGSWDGT